MKTYWNLRKDTFKCWVGSLRWHSAPPYLSVLGIMELSEWGHFVCPFLLLKKKKYVNLTCKRYWSTKWIIYIWVQSYKNNFKVKT